MTARSIIQVTVWNSPYLGNFMSSQLALAGAVRARFGLGTHFVLAAGAGEQPWLTDLDSAGATWSILSPRRDSWRAHLDSVVDAHGAAIVHTHFTTADIRAAGAAFAAGVPCVWHIHTGFNGYPLRQRGKDFFKFRIVARQRVARIIVVSPWLVELTRRRGAPADRIDLVANAIVVERFARLPDRLAARERFGLDANADVVVGLGWWPEVKGVDVLLDALGLLAERRSNLQVLLVGEERMRSFIAQRLPGPLPPWLRLSGFVSDAAWLFAAADIFVSASRHEGHATAVGEALACGLPVVMSDIPGTTEWEAAPGVLTFPTEDAGVLGARLEQLLDQPPTTRAAAGAQNRLWVQRHAGIDPWCAQLCEIYSSLL